MKFKRLLFILPLALGLVVTSCKVGGDKKSDNDMVDYVAQAHLTDFSTYGTYENKNFLDNGIGLCELYNPVDGDTAHFYQKETEDGRKSRLVKVRFYGIDTPESTGKIQEINPINNFTII